ncbi:unnamed protein product [Caretta caretta]
MFGLFILQSEIPWQLQVLSTSGLKPKTVHFFSLEAQSCEVSSICKSSFIQLKARALRISQDWAIGKDGPETRIANTAGDQLGLTVKSSEIRRIQGTTDQSALPQSQKNHGAGFQGIHFEALGGEEGDQEQSTWIQQG